MWRALVDHTDSPHFMLLDLVTKVDIALMDRYSKSIRHHATQRKEGWYIVVN